MLSDEIRSLIALKQEGDYWDFKREWYSKEKRSDLLHDIICMANNLSNRDAYIIIGIDEENDYTVRSVEGDCNRRNTQQIVNILRDIEFAGGYRPIVSVESIDMNKKQIDVIIIHNSNSTPFYLTERYRDVNANNIYTRVMDSNTPKDKSADLPYIEKLWRKRFGLLLSPLDRMKIFLKQPSLWDNSPAKWNKDKKYYRFSPEFTIEWVVDRDNKNYDFYCAIQTSNNFQWHDINLYYNQTILMSLEGISFESGIYFTPSPKTDSFLANEDKRVNFKYFTKDSVEYAVHEFFHDTKDSSQGEAFENSKENVYNSFIICILIFDNNNEKEEFKEFVLEKWKCRDKYKKCTPTISWGHFEELNAFDTNKLQEEYQNSQILQKMLEEFRGIEPKSDIEV